MKKSQLKKMIREAILEDVKALDLITKEEIDIIMEMGQELLDYQNGKYDDAGWDNPKATFLKGLKSINSKSSIKGYEDAFAYFIEDNIDNPLPNPSSGSFLTALTDIDGTLYSLGYEDDKFTNEQLNAAYKYYEEKRAGLVHNNKFKNGEKI